MSSTASREASACAAALFEGVIAEVAEGRVRLHRADLAGALVDARNAVHGYLPSEGDRVLCAASEGGVYVTGVLVARLAPGALEVDGARATVEDGQIVLRGDDGGWIARYDAKDGVTLSAPEKLRLAAPEIEIEADALTQRVRQLVTEADQVAISADRWSLRANRIRERAKDVFRDVESLLQVRAGTLRSIARGGMSLFAHRTSIRSEKDTAVDGERVLLG